MKKNLVLGHLKTEDLLKVEIEDAALSDARVAVYWLLAILFQVEIGPKHSKCST